MSDYYITPTESQLSISRINRVTANHPAADLNFSTKTLSGTVIGTNLNPNSKISELADKSYKYLFSQNITSLTKQPIKFSDFRNNVFFAADISVKPETPSAYANANDGQIVITPFGGTGEAFNVQLAQNDAIETYIDGYSPGVLKRSPFCNVRSTETCKNHPWSYGNPIPITKTRIVRNILADATFLSGGNLTISSGLDMGIQYVAGITNLDNNLNVINSFLIYITIHLGGYRYYAGHQRHAYGSDEASRSAITTRHYFSR